MMNRGIRTDNGEVYEKSRSAIPYFYVEGLVTINSVSTRPSVITLIHLEQAEWRMMLT